MFVTYIYSVRHCLHCRRIPSAVFFAWLRDAPCVRRHTARQVRAALLLLRAMALRAARACLRQVRAAVAREAAFAKSLLLRSALRCV